ncbi:MAG: S1 RNA-binding domain-containing protein [Oscillospiraceae bacterium]
MQQRKILQAPAIKCDERHDLHIALGCCAGVMPRAEAARGILGGETRDIAILSRVGRPVCFTVMGFAPDGTALLSRRSAQEAALEQIFREKRPGDILPAVVTGLAPFGAFCDIGCGAVGLLGLRNLCVSRLTHPRELLRVGQQLPVLIQSLDPARRRVGLTLRELLGTWQENAARFRAGADRDGDRLRKNGLWRVYCADTEICAGWQNGTIHWNPASRYACTSRPFTRRRSS